MSVWVKYSRLLWFRRGSQLGGSCLPLVHLSDILFIKDNQWNFWWKVLSDVQSGGMCVDFVDDKKVTGSMLMLVC